MFYVYSTRSAALLLLLCLLSTQAQTKFNNNNKNNEEEKSSEKTIAKIFKLTVGENFFIAPNFKITTIAKDFLKLNDDECIVEDEDDDEGEDNVEVTASPIPIEQTPSSPSSQFTPLPTSSIPTTSAPSERTRVSCPDQPAEGSSNHTIILPDSVLYVLPSEKDTLCSLNFVMTTEDDDEKEEVTIPIGRSYTMETLGNQYQAHYV